MKPSIPEVAEPDHEDPKEVYAFTGLALYWAQIVERGLVSLAACIKRANTEAVSPQLLDEIYDKLEAKTFGQLLVALRTVAVVPLPFDLETQLRRALSLRNRLVHEFFWNRAEDFMCGSGRASMLLELREMVVAFRGVNQEIEELTYPIMQKWGVTQAMLDEEFEKLSRIASARSEVRDA